MYLGIDIGGTRMKVGLVDRQAHILRSASAATPGALEPLRFALRQLVRDVLEDRTPAAVGFGCKGIIDPATTHVDRLPGEWQFLEGTRLGEILDELVPPDVPMTADNDAKAALAGEMVWGAARGLKNALLLTLGTGVGGAILADGKILRGATGVAGHLGHIMADPDGPPCMCGSRGCLETVFSSRAIEAEAWSAMHLGAKSPLLDRLRESPGELSCRMIFEAAAARDWVAERILQRRIAVLSAAVAGLLHAFDPETVIVSGQISEAGEQLFGPLRQQVYIRSNGLLQRAVPIVPGSLADTSGIVGAAGLAYLACQLRQ